MNAREMVVTNALLDRTSLGGMQALGVARHVLEKLNEYDEENDHDTGSSRTMGRPD